MSILLRYQVLGGHTHIEVFVGARGTRGRAGTLVLENGEWEAIRRLLPASVEVEERVPDCKCPPGCRTVTQQVNSSYCRLCREVGLGA